MSIYYQTAFEQVDDWTFTDTTEQNYILDNKQVVFPNSKTHRAILSNSLFTDFSFSVEVQVLSPTTGQTSALGEAGILFRVQENTESAGYYFGLDIEQQQVIFGKLEKQHLEWHQIANRKMALDYETKYLLTVSVSGNHIQCFVNKQADSFPVVDVLDEQFNTGTVGLVSNATETAFSNLSVKSFVADSIVGATYLNPIIPGVADPDVLLHNGTYYLYPTTTDRNVGGIKVYTSTDLTNWTNQGMAMKAGEDNWGTEGFWAPDIIERDGKFYMYYTANEHLCMAVSESPLGPFIQEEFGPLHEDIQEIDAHVFKDDDGQYYFYFVRFTAGNVIWGAKLNDDMRSIDQNTLTELLVPSQEWEKDIAPVNEGPYMLKKDGIYYLTYSGAHFVSPMYGVGYATSTHPLGPYTKYKQNPIMQSNDIVHGAGHHGITFSPDGTEIFLAYHVHYDLENANPRKFAIDRVRFSTDESGKTFLEVHGPTVTNQTIPSGAVNANNLIDISPIEEILLVAKDSTIDTMCLPATVKIRTSQTSFIESIEAKINWNVEEFDPNIATQTISGEVVLPDDISNLGNQSLEVTINLQTETTV